MYAWRSTTESPRISGSKSVKSRRKLRSRLRRRNWSRKRRRWATCDRNVPVAELPLNARNFASLIFLSPGAVPSFDRDSSSLSGTTRRGVSNTAINGIRPTNDWNSLLIEGIDNTENHNAFGVGHTAQVSLPEWLDPQALECGYIEIGPRYFETIRTPVLRGREFDDRDTLQSPTVAIVNETLGRRLWPTGTVIGATLIVNRRPRQVVGVVKDVPLQSRDTPS